MPPSKIMTQPINLIFRFLQNRTKVVIWLYEETNFRIEGRISGFDEYMNLVLDEAVEWNVKKNTRINLGRILLKGDTITLIQPAQT
ncbi:small nuclear ribonucleoprotein E [Galdieria sulphuraria]|uniref:Small nuclear ribonucleoprotein E n=1 Tax=Galdieria sulphuraria TaxID=130081 RepID=M2Y213_GALSU|nr:small nuclear ribonucleoprotein E [Galdieria sulphuraria]EME30008.1 small nuclear ribonucleoprotein E [Galdieria sulphuraria]|eukprot:XP_005706528.1 small nuclear ribonucleoprotein E [Galdieria sulphuraria]